MELFNFPNNKVASSFICAISTVPYYMNKYKEWVDKDVDFNELPFTTKDDIIDSKLPMINITCQEKFRRGELRMGRSSGTTGKITEIFYDPQEHTKSLQELWFYRLKWYGIHAGKDKVLYFYPTTDQTPIYQDTPTKITISKPYLFKFLLLFVMLSLTIVLYNHLPRLYYIKPGKKRDWLRLWK